MRIYIETTVFNYRIDRKIAHHADVCKLFEEIKEGKHEAFTSRYVTDELAATPDEAKRNKMLALPDQYGMETLPFSKETERLANLYIERGALPPKSWDDATHVAAASTKGVEGLVPV